MKRPAAQENFSKKYWFNKEDKIDIEKATTTLSKLSKYNFSQGTVVRNNKVISVEGKGGTDTMLMKCKNKKFKNKVRLKCKRFIDGRGAERSAQKIINYYKNTIPSQVLH